jgi:hypothetical protein
MLIAFTFAQMCEPHGQLYGSVLRVETGTTHLDSDKIVELDPSQLIKSSV